MVKLKVPPRIVGESKTREKRYLTHCNNVARILAHTSRVRDIVIAEYCKITGAELAAGDEND